MRNYIDIVEKNNIPLNEGIIKDLVSTIKDRAITTISSYTTTLINKLFKAIDNNDLKNKVEAYKKSLMLLGVEIDTDLENTLGQIAANPKLEDYFVHELSKFLLKNMLEDIHAVSYKMSKQDKQLAWNMLKKAEEELLIRKTRNATSLAKLALWLNEFYPIEKVPANR